MTTPCSHGMPSPASCVDCMDDGNIPERPNPVWHRVLGLHDFNARYAGTCVLCERSILAGQRITTLEKGDQQGYAHTGCLG